MEGKEFVWFMEIESKKSNDRLTLLLWADFRPFSSLTNVRSSALTFVFSFHFTEWFSLSNKQ
jgi:hypothetical protein